jgi:very-short-patch-repair endonuclease
MASSEAQKALPDGLLSALCEVYAETLRRMGTATTQFVRWSRVTGRAHDFAWLGGMQPSDVLMHGNGPIRLDRTNALYDAVMKMRTTAMLNPYERELLYGYPYIIGRRDGETIRAPLLTLSVQVDIDGDSLLVASSDDVIKVNALPFRPMGDLRAHEEAVARIIARTPELPVRAEPIRHLLNEIRAQFPYVDPSTATLDGRLSGPPAEPHSGDGLWVIDQAALFIAPKTGYFLASDLDHIGSMTDEAAQSALAPLLAGPGSEAQVDIDPIRLDTARIYFPFPSNRSQRRVALLTEDLTTRVVRVEGPPGTGKSLTIANLACHLAATGRSVLVTSQKDKALEVVDQKLRELNLAELPMTLLHRDRDSKGELLRRLDDIKKERSEHEVRLAYETLVAQFSGQIDRYGDEVKAYAGAIDAEQTIERTHRELLASRGPQRLYRGVRFWHQRWRASRAAKLTSDAVAESASARRQQLLRLSVAALRLGRELAVAAATREERARLRELAAVLKRDQTRYKNFSIFDRLKSEPDRAPMLLKLLPVWIMTPDDVARLFPCEAGVFDVVIVDEASQVDLPSITPIAYRGKKVLVFGDSRQMQPRRFAFMSQDVTRLAWERSGMERLDPNRWLHPGEQSLLTLLAVRAEEEALLDEHYRSLPAIISFSNHQWYHDTLRIMTDEARKRFGGPDQPIMQLHHVANGVISGGSQENEVEAKALVDFLSEIMDNPDYDGASIGVICLFEEQVALVQDLVEECIPVQDWERHDLVVINPDGFQGDERDVILYSLSYDARVMPQAAISARMQAQAHIQGMLNVAFTRARDEVHVFHSAPIEEFTFADGRSSTLSEWLAHCATVQDTPRSHVAGSRLGRVDSEFEADVAAALRGRGLRVLHQYPSCGFHIDLVCFREEEARIRIAVECDGERYHLDEHGELKIEDLERQAILERAGWRVVRIPYRKWIANPNAEVGRVLQALADISRKVEGDDQPPIAPSATIAVESVEGISGSELIRTDQRVAWVTTEQEAIVHALKTGLTSEDAVLLHARTMLGAQRLTQKLRRTLQSAATDLVGSGLMVREDGEYFLTEDGRQAILQQRPPAVRASRPHRPYRRWRWI